MTPAATAGTKRAITFLAGWVALDVSSPNHLLHLQSVWITTEQRYDQRMSGSVIAVTQRGRTIQRVCDPAPGRVYFLDFLDGLACFRGCAATWASARDTHSPTWSAEVVSGRLT